MLSTPPAPVVPLVVADVAVGVAPAASCGLLLLLPLVWLFLFVLSVDELETSERAVSSLLRSGGGVAYMDAAILDDITAGRGKKDGKGETL